MLLAMYAKVIQWNWDLCMKVAQMELSQESDLTHVWEEYKKIFFSGFDVSII